MEIRILLCNVLLELLGGFIQSSILPLHKHFCIRFVTLPYQYSVKNSNRLGVKGTSVIYARQVGLDHLGTSKIFLQPRNMKYIMYFC